MRMRANRFFPRSAFYLKTASLSVADPQGEEALTT